MATRSRDASGRNGAGELLEELVDRLAGALRDVRPGSFSEDPKATEARLRYRGLRDAILGYDPEATPQPPPPSVYLSTTRAARSDIVMLRSELLDEQSIVYFGKALARVTNFDPEARVLAIVVPEDAESGEMRVIGPRFEFSTAFEIVEPALVTATAVE